MAERVLLHFLDELPAIIGAILAGVAAIQARHANKAARGARDSSDRNGQALVETPYIRVDRREEQRP